MFGLEPRGLGWVSDGFRKVLNLEKKVAGFQSLVFWCVVLRVRGRTLANAKGNSGRRNFPSTQTRSLGGVSLREGGPAKAKAFGPGQGEEDFVLRECGHWPAKAKARGDKAPRMRARDRERDGLLGLTHYERDRPIANAMKVCLVILKQKQKRDFTKNFITSSSKLQIGRFLKENFTTNP